MHVRKDDLVQVISGDDALSGKPHKVLRVLPEDNKVVVEGVNLVKKHVKPSRRHPRGGQLSKEMPISAANVLLWCNTCGRGVRTGRRVTGATKERYCKKCGNALGQVGKAGAAQA